MTILEEVWTALFSIIIIVSVIGNLAVLWIVFGRVFTKCVAFSMFREFKLCRNYIVGRPEDRFR
jgi:hypothetical protein